MPKISKAKGYTAADMAVVSDNPKWTKDDFKAAKKFAEVFPDLTATMRRGRGPNKIPTKKLVSLRLSQNVVDHFKSMGPGWQTRIDETLQHALRKRQPKRGKVAG